MPRLDAVPRPQVTPQLLSMADKIFLALVLPAVCGLLLHPLYTFTLCVNQKEPQEVLQIHPVLPKARTIVHTIPIVRQ